MSNTERMTDQAQQPAQIWLVVYGEGGCWSGYPYATIIEGLDKAAANRAAGVIALRELPRVRRTGTSFDVEQIDPALGPSGTSHYASRLRPEAKVMVDTHWENREAVLKHWSQVLAPLEVAEADLVAEQCFVLDKSALTNFITARIKESSGCTAEEAQSLAVCITEPPASFSFSSWRHGGWYVSNVRYPSGAIGCVSNNYADGKWRVVCDERRDGLNEPGDFTFPTREAAAHGEFELALQEWKAAAEAASVDQSQDDGADASQYARPGASA